MSKQYIKLAGRYATALQKAVEESGSDARSVASELEQLAQLWSSNLELSTSLQNPFFSKEDRMKSLQQVLQASQVSDVLRKFVSIVFERDRIKAIAEMSEIFSQRVEAAAGLMHVQVTVAREPGADEKSTIESSISERLQGKVEYKWSVDPTILGGLVVEYGGHVLDGSVSGRLDRLEKELLG